MKSAYSRVSAPLRARTTARWLTVVAAMLIALVPVGGAHAADVVDLPKDEGPHPVTHEWWYYTGHVAGKDRAGKNHSYGYELTVFRGGGVYKVAGNYTAHLAVTDLDRGDHVFDQRFAITPDRLPTGGGFDLRTLDWMMSGANGKGRLSAGMLNGSYKLALNFDSTRPAAKHGNGGLIPYGPLSSSYYYSQTNIATTGTIVDHGVPVQVSGTSWFDHQWGNFGVGPAGWDWFSIQLDNDTEYMVYLVKDSKGNIVERIVTRVNADGTSTPIDGAQVSEAVNGTWRSPHTGQNYSSGWTLTVPEGTITVTPRVKDQELFGVIAPNLHYWEGACAVSAVINGKSVSGQGYTELTPPGFFPPTGSIDPTHRG